MKQPFKRIGYEKDAIEVMQHPFFTGLDWLEAEQRQLTPSFKPDLSSANDVQMFEKFEKKFQPPIDSFVNSTLSPEQKVNFKCFEFNGERKNENNQLEQ